jgi:hypothetical protein
VLKSKGKTCMVEEPSHIKQLSLNHVCKIGLKDDMNGFPSTLNIYFISSRIACNRAYMFSVQKAHGWLLYLVNHSLNK